MTNAKTILAVALAALAAEARAQQAAPASPTAPAVASASPEQAAQAGEQSFAMALRALKPSGLKPKKGDEQNSPVSVYFAPYGASEDNRYTAFGLEMPLNGKGTSATGAIMGFSHAQGIQMMQYDPFTGSYNAIDLSRRWGLEVGLRQSVGRVGYGTKDGKGVYLEPYGTVGVTPFSLGSGIDAAQTAWVDGVKTMKSPSAYYGVGGKVNLWNVVSVGAERRWYTGQTAPQNQTQPYTTYMVSLTQHGMKAIANLFGKDQDDPQRTR